jgi:hypothetical protein
MARNRARARIMAPMRIASADEAAITGWWVANHVSPTAAVSSMVLRAMFEIGSGLGVTAARTAILELCVARAMVAPIAVARICICGES